MDGNDNKKLPVFSVNHKSKAVFLLMALSVMAWFIVGCGARMPMHNGAMREHHNAIHGKSPAPPAGPAVETLSVAIEAFAFQPRIIKVHTGATVTWTNRDAVPHTVTFKNSEFKSALLTQHESWGHTFMQVGNYSYFCEPHPWMTGQVIVEATKD
ncbi:cupredoxin family copper-binding protein [Candidatus Acetothermia bacterium]|nr:cupredoxin family copper-binding protein [Candidatus Acetothermia bacterium]MBI3460927.1 cupredoxin family copper-binding protein [Candidatus Acetothermia bacterium]MBI3661178.1 cupredoxin family copper-binding protein [Candidatus Acetothermia bacterium]